MIGDILAHERMDASTSFSFMHRNASIISLRTITKSPLTYQAVMPPSTRSEPVIQLASSDAGMSPPGDVLRTPRRQASLASMASQPGFCANAAWVASLTIKPGDSDSP